MRLDDSLFEDKENEKEKDDKKFEDAITMMRLAGNIQSEKPEVVMAIALSALYKESKGMYLR